MGGEVVVHAFSILYREADLADAEVEIEDVVLTAPDVDRVEFITLRCMFPPTIAHC
jgi:esterase/lipase superfamily enzyme